MEPLFRHILVPIDGSEPSLQAVQMALRIIALCPACKMTVLYVIDKLVLNELAASASIVKRKWMRNWKNRAGAIWISHARTPSTRA